MFQKPDPKQSFPQLEEQILAFWETNNTFFRSIEQRQGAEEYVFYDGPPFATGLPHYGHILAGTMKDVVPRYHTMRGRRVERRWGWDCHGLPVENLIEKELGLADKKALQKFGVGNFNEACRSSVLKYVNEWRQTVKRMGRWVDFEDSYKTMDGEFMESVWWVFKSLWDKKLIYKGKKTMQICPRCVTPLSNFEVGLGYKDITDFSCIWKFPLESEKNTYLLAWTTTPWSTLSTMGLSIGPNFDYVKVQVGNENLIFAKARMEFVLKGMGEYKVLETFKGQKLVGQKYAHLVDLYKKLPEVKSNKNVYKVYAGDYVEVTEGTGIVTINGSYGEIDFLAAKKNGLPMVMDVSMEGKFTKLAGKYAGLSVKEAEKRLITDKTKEGLVHRAEPYRHSYPHCWRCETPLLHYANDAWFVAVEKIKEKMLAANQKIHWVPDHIKNGRFGTWLENARDWCVSRNRYWGTPLPVWQSADGQTTECIGSMAELRSKMSGRITKITFIRHGESEGNTIHLFQGQPPGTPLTPVGKQQSKDAAKLMAAIHKKEKFDVLLTSPLLRTKETAAIIGAAIKKKPLVDADITEISFGIREGQTEGENKEETTRRGNLSPEAHYADRIGQTRVASDNPIEGESHHHVELRMQQWLKKVLKKHKGKSIAVVTHSDPIRCLLRGLKNDSFEKFYQKGHLPMAKPVELYFDVKTGTLLDLHSHHVDTMAYKSKGKTFKRIPEVLDCWFESGSMPYAQAHYPFENKEWFENNFPAQFIAEGLDQTRGWFYTLIVLSAALFDEPAFRNVIVNGIVLAEDGQKMSKSKQNYPPPERIFNEFGADAMRLYLMNSPVIKGDDLRFSEKGVSEVLRSILIPLWNAYSFLLTYAEIDGWKPKGQIFFARHGETDMNRDHRLQGHTNISLNPAGLKQAHDLARRCKNLPIDLVISSDLERARETTSIIYESLRHRKKLPPLVMDQSFREQSLGEFDSQPIIDVIKKKPKGMSESFFYRTHHKTGQKLEDYERQVLDGVKKSQRKHPDANILIVAHAGTGHVLRKYFLGISTWEEYFNTYGHFKNTELVSFSFPIGLRSNTLDAWILSELNTLIKTTTSALEEYDLQKATEPLFQFVDTLTNWYIRRSRRRFWKSQNDKDKSEAYETLYFVLKELSQLLAPFAPFVSEAIYQNLTGKESVHLSNWPRVNESAINPVLNTQIALTRKIVTLGHAARSASQVKVRQPLSVLEVALPASVEPKTLEPQISVIADELNVKAVRFLKRLPKEVRPVARPSAKVLGPIHGALVQDIIAAAKSGRFKLNSDGTVAVTVRRKKLVLSPLKNEVEVGYESNVRGKKASIFQVQGDQGIVVILNTQISADLRREGIARELVRAIQEMRKEADLKVSDHIRVGLVTRSADIKKAIEQHAPYLRAETLCDELLSKALPSRLRSSVIPSGAKRSRGIPQVQPISQATPSTLEKLLQLEGESIKLTLERK